MTGVETARLPLRTLTADDAPFMPRLLNEPPQLEDVDIGVSSFPNLLAGIRVRSRRSDRSARLLSRLGCTFERNVRMAPDGEELKLFGAG